jgi:hypothetical protein
MMHLSARAIPPLAAVLLLAAAPLAQAKLVKFSGTFAPEGAATTMPTGHVHGTFNTVTDKVTYHIVYAHLSGPVIAAHFHGPAAPGQEAGVLLPIPGPYHSGMHGTLTANAATATALLAGKTYVNLHTTAYPMGEARAQVTPGQ